MGGSASEVEGVQPAGGFRPAAVHPLNVGRLRTTLGCQLEPLQVRPAALRDKLNRAVVLVAHPAAQPEAAGLPHQKPSKAHALHVAMYHAM